MEKTVVLQHGEMKALVPQVRRFETRDYAPDDFRASGNAALDSWRIKKLAEYLAFGFPAWKRTNLKNIELPPAGEYGGLEGIDELGLETLESLDFEGSDRKFVLLADTFSESGTYKVVLGDEKLVLSDFAKYDNELFVVEKGTLELVRVIRKDFFVGNLRVLVKPGARLKLYNLYLGTDETKGLTVSNTFVEAQTGSTLYVWDFYFGGRWNVGFFGLRIAGEGVRADVKPQYLASKDSVVDVMYLVRFYSGASYGNVDARGVAAGSSKVVFRGIMDIRSGCKGAEAHQSNHTLLVSKSAKVEAIPSLLVGEHEVEASHASSSAPIDEGLTFYLTSRGIPYDEARRMIVEGVFTELREELEEYDLGGLIVDALGSVVGSVVE